MLAILDESPLRVDLNEKMIRAEAAVRIAVRKFGGGKGGESMFVLVSCRY